MLYGRHVYPQLENALVSQRRQSERWGCGFEVLQRDIAQSGSGDAIGPPRTKMFSKQYFLMSAMLRELAKPAKERQEWLFWADADAIVTNPALSPEVFLPPAHLKDVYALVTADQNGFNAGIFYLRVTHASLELLTQTVAYPLMHPDEDLGWFGEQAAMANVMKVIEANQTTASYPGIVWMPRTWFNAYQLEQGFEGKPGDMHVHFAGLGATRLSHMANWLEVLEQTPDKWEMSLERTYFKDDLAEFWRNFEANITKRGIDA